MILSRKTYNAIGQTRLDGDFPRLKIDAFDYLSNIGMRGSAPRCWHSP